jgi:cysteine desulfurase/selenocysteine lyase
MVLDVETLRADFPALTRQVNGNPLVYFDNAASLQMPKPVMDRVVRYHSGEHANVHRGVHTLSYEATMMYEGVRDIIRQAYHVPESHEILYTSGTTQSINTVAYGLRPQLKAGDVILVTFMEHHANLVPWQMAAEATGAMVKAVPVMDNGALDVESFRRLLDENPKVVAFTAISNVSGVINPVDLLLAEAKAAGAITVLDAAQAVAHHQPLFGNEKADFVAFSAHKIGGPTGTGVLIGKRTLLQSMQPMMGGGDMIRTVDIEKSTWAELPHTFEAGTPNISGVIGMGEAVLFWQNQDKQALIDQENSVAGYLRSRLSDVKGLSFIGFDVPQASTVSFVISGLHPHDIGTFLDQEGIAVRVGHHCAQPLMKRFGIPGTIRASIAPYNTLDEAAYFCEALNRTITLLR